MRKALLPGLLFAIASQGATISAQEPTEADPVVPERVDGKCQHVSSELRDWVFAAGHNVVGSHRCDFARIDWDREVSFYHVAPDGEERVAASFFGERDKAWNDLEISAVSILPGEKHDATGTCRHPREEGLAARKIRCFASYTVGDTRHATMIDFSFNDPVWPDKGEVSLEGKCKPSGLAEAVLVPWIGQLIDALPEVAATDTVECDRVVIRVDTEYGFLAPGSTKPLRFQGKPRGDEPGALLLERIVYPDGSTEDVVVGSCVTFRHTEGYFIPVCNAATGDPAKPRIVEAALARDGQKFPWEEQQ